MDLAFGGAVPEPSAWAMMFVGSAGLGYAGVAGQGGYGCSPPDRTFQQESQ